MKNFKLKESIFQSDYLQMSILVDECEDLYYCYLADFNSDEYDFAHIVIKPKSNDLELYLKKELSAREMILNSVDKYWITEKNQKITIENVDFFDGDLIPDENSYLWFDFR